MNFSVRQLGINGIVILISVFFFCFTPQLPALVVPYQSIEQSDVQGAPPMDEETARFLEEYNSCDRDVTQHIIPASYTGTGQWEPICYQEPPNYDPLGPPVPLVVAWHSYSHSCLEPSAHSGLDEECANRGWFYLAPACKGQYNFGHLGAQIHCTKAIQYMMDPQEFGYNIDTSRIYMVGFSMGAGGLLSYTCRHMSEANAYPVAGAILVASKYDLIEAFNNNDAGVVTHVPGLLGGNPSQVPFKWKQISTLFIENNTYVLNQSMGQNLQHNLPVYITYADNDSAGVLNQNAIMDSMLYFLGCNYQMVEKSNEPKPHSWDILDIPAAFDWIQQFTLEDQETDTLSILADDDQRFYWVEVQKELEDQFSLVQGSVDAPNNKLNITESSNMDWLKVDCSQIGLVGGQNLLLSFYSSHGSKQPLTLWPINPEPNYVVNSDGELFEDWGYNALAQALNIQCPPEEQMDLKTTFVPYNLTLDAPALAPLGRDHTIELSGGQGGDSCFLFLSATQKETLMLGHYFLVDPNPPTIWYPTVLDGSGSTSVTFTVPNDPAYLNATIYQQYLTHTGNTINEVSNMVATLIQ